MIALKAGKPEFKAGHPACASNSCTGGQGQVDSAVASQTSLAKNSFWFCEKPCLRTRKRITRKEPVSLLCLQHVWAQAACIHTPPMTTSLPPATWENKVEWRLLGAMGTLQRGETAERVMTKEDEKVLDMDSSQGLFHTKWM